VCTTIFHLFGVQYEVLFSSVLLTVKTAFSVLSVILNWKCVKIM